MLFSRTYAFPIGMDPAAVERRLSHGLVAMKNIVDGTVSNGRIVVRRVLEGNEGIMAPVFKGRLMEESGRTLLRGSYRPRLWLQLLAAVIGVAAGLSGFGIGVMGITAAAVLFALLDLLVAWLGARFAQSEIDAFLSSAAGESGEVP